MTQEKQLCFCDFCSLKREYLKHYNSFLKYGADPKQIEKMIKEDEKRLVCVKKQARRSVLRLSPNSVYAQTKGAVK